MSCSSSFLGRVRTTPITLFRLQCLTLALFLSGGFGLSPLLAGNGGGSDNKLPTKSDQRDPAYNAEWGQGRGFRVGQTLPDIPLYDLDGKEVRFSKYLGKQYIVYAWASW
ncbi:MAG: TlpA family protein disulfide reductase [Gemmataceae bacterium]